MELKEPVEMPASEVASAFRDVLDRTEHQGQITVISRWGRRTAVLVPLDRARAAGLVREEVTSE